MKSRTTLATLLSALALAGGLSIFPAASAQASPPRDCGQCGLFGLARGQVARINVVNIGDSNQRRIQVEMLFLDAMGAAVARDAKTIAPGHAVFFDFPFVAGSEENRIELRAVINAQSPPDPDKILRVTVEVFDAATGKTTVFISNPEI